MKLMLALLIAFSAPVTYGQVSTSVSAVEPVGEATGKALQQAVNGIRNKNEDPSLNTLKVSYKDYEFHCSVFESLERVQSEALEDAKIGARIYDPNCQGEACISLLALKTKAEGLLGSFHTQSLTLALDESSACYWKKLPSKTGSGKFFKHPTELCGMLVKNEDGEVLEGFLKSLSPGEVKFCRETAIAKNTNLGPVNSKRQKESLGRVMISDPSCLEEMSSEKFKGVPFREAMDSYSTSVGDSAQSKEKVKLLTKVSEAECKLENSSDTKNAFDHRNEKSLACLEDLTVSCLLLKAAVKAQIEEKLKTTSPKNRSEAGTSPTANTSKIPFFRAKKPKVNFDSEVSGEATLEPAVRAAP